MKEFQDMGLITTLEDMGLTHDTDKWDDTIAILEKIEENTRPPKKKPLGTTVFMDSLDIETDVCQIATSDSTENVEFCSTYCPTCAEWGARYNKASSWRRLDIIDDFVLKVVTLPIALLFAPFGTLKGGDDTLLNSNLMLLPEKTTHFETTVSKPTPASIPASSTDTEKKDDGINWLREYGVALEELDAMKASEKHQRDVFSRMDRDDTLRFSEDEKTPLQLRFEKLRKERIA